MCPLLFVDVVASQVLCVHMKLVVLSFEEVQRFVNQILLENSMVFIAGNSLLYSPASFRGILWNFGGKWDRSP